MTVINNNAADNDNQDEIKEIHIYVCATCKMTLQWVFVQMNYILTS